MTGNCRNGHRNYFVQRIDHFPKGLALLVDHIGNDLVRIENEIDKLSVNLGKRTAISEEDIEQYIGVSKDYNVLNCNRHLHQRPFP